MSNYSIKVDYDLDGVSGFSKEFIHSTGSNLSLEYRSQPLNQSPSFQRHYGYSKWVVILFLSVIIGRIGYLAIVKGDENLARAERNLESYERLEAPRGNIYDNQNRPLAYNRDSYDVLIIRRGLDEHELNESLRKTGELFEEDFLQKKDDILADPDPWTLHRLSRKAPLETVLPIKERPEDYPGVRLEKQSERIYPYGPNFAHIIGYMGKIQAEQIETYTRPLYLPNSSVGQAGLEKQLESELVGKRGVLEKKVNARRRLLAEPVITEVAQAGQDIQLTIDAELQRYACQLIGERHGSVVFMDVQTGELLVLASMPTFDPTSPGKKEVDGIPVSYVNRATQGLYPPGSTFKIVTASAALENGRAITDQVVCNGHYTWPGWSRRFHCDVRSGHGPISLIESIKKSCNVYYYEQGEWLGGESLGLMAERFGFGHTTGLDIRGEKAGSFANDSDYPLEASVINFSIGQGEFLATPLQVAYSYALLANNGKRLRPHVIATGDYTRESDHPEPVHLSSTERTAIIEGLWEVANEYGGTAYRADFDPSWNVVGKTGTAENYQGGVDAWFAGFYPRSNPKYAFVSHVEQADGHGGDVAAPIIREMIRMIEAENDSIDSTTALAH